MLIVTSCFFRVLPDFWSLDTIQTRGHVSRASCKHYITNVSHPIENLLHAIGQTLWYNIMILTLEAPRF